MRAAGKFGSMNKTVLMAIASVVLALAATEQSYEQYTDSGTEVTAETLKKCEKLEIPRTQCNESTVLQAERIGLAKTGNGSGTSILAKETEQMIIFIGVLGAIFGSVAGAFFIAGKKSNRISA